MKAKMGLRIFSHSLPMIAIIFVIASAASTEADNNKATQDKLVSHRHPARYPQPNQHPLNNPHSMACSNCKEIDSFLKTGGERIDTLLGKAADILEESRPCPSRSSDVKVIVSEESGHYEGAVAIARCPEKLLELVNCRCSGEDDSCQGVTVTPDKFDRGCIAHNGPGGYTVKAIAMCTDDDVDTLGDFSLKKSTPASSNPIAWCDTDEEMLDCWIKNGRPQDGLIKTVISDDFQHCRTSAKCADGDNGCQLTAFCYRRSS